MRSVLTKKGDKVQTGLADVTRVEKNDTRIEANGCLDERKSVVGIVRAMTRPEMAEAVRMIQLDLMSLMTIVAGGHGDISALR